MTHHDHDKLEVIGNGNVGGALSEGLKDADDVQTVGDAPKAVEPATDRYDGPDILANNASIADGGETAGLVRNPPKDQEATA